MQILSGTHSRMCCCVRCSSTCAMTQELRYREDHGDVCDCLRHSLCIFAEAARSELALLPPDCVNAHPLSHVTGCRASFLRGVLPCSNNIPPCTAEAKEAMSITLPGARMHMLHQCR